MPDHEKMLALIETIAAATLWNEDPDNMTPDGGVTRDFQEAREEEAQDWIIEARTILSRQSK